MNLFCHYMRRNLLLSWVDPKAATFEILAPSHVIKSSEFRMLAAEFG
ncbi:hypothetical protein PRJ_5429 [Pseudomonas sp. XWY-1]|nr:hypothetical protein PRJ_5429 [Pseudomonas sp. XWY-1]